MRDVFYTILVVWIVWRIVNAYNSHSAKRHGNGSNSYNNNEEGKTTIKYNPPVTKKTDDDEGEYVDFEEIK